MGDRRPGVADPLRAPLGLERETPQADGCSQAAVEGGTGDALGDLGEPATPALRVPPAEVEMETRGDVAHGLRDVGSDPALVGELPVPVGDGAAAKLHQQLLVEVHPDVGPADAADDEVGTVMRQAPGTGTRAPGGLGQAQHERIDPGAVEPDFRAPDDAAETRGRGRESGGVDLRRPRLRGHPGQAGQQQREAGREDAQEHGSAGDGVGVVYLSVLGSKRRGTKPPHEHSMRATASARPEACRQPEASAWRKASAAGRGANPDGASAGLQSSRRAALQVVVDEPVEGKGRSDRGAVSRIEDHAERTRAVPVWILTNTGRSARIPVLIEAARIPVPSCLLPECSNVDGGVRRACVYRGRLCGGGWVPARLCGGGLLLCGFGRGDDGTLERVEPLVDAGEALLDGAHAGVETVVVFQ